MDHDAQGRIYIANNYGGSGYDLNTVFRVDNISGTNKTDIGQVNMDNGVKYIAIDRNNDILYYCFLNPLESRYEVYRLSTDNLAGASEYINLQAIVTDIYGIAVDEDGYLYVSDYNTVYKIDPDTASEVDSFTHVEIDTISDIIVKGDFLYIANLWASDGWHIIEINMTNGQSHGYGHLVIAEDFSKGAFYGVHGFEAVLNKKITIIDENTGGLDKLVSMDDIEGTNWATFDFGGAFQFYC